MKKEILIQIEDYEKPIKELVGKSISFINYFEVDYEKPFWDEVEFHSLDFGFELIMNDSETYYFIWGHDFAKYNVRFSKGAISNEFGDMSNVKQHSKINSPKWNKLINHKIKGIKSIWSYWGEVGNEKKKHYPETIKLEFENQKNIWISALEIIDNKVNGMADHLTIIFDTETIKKYRIEMNNVV